jgi:hypothetical protein
MCLYWTALFKQLNGMNSPTKVLPHHSKNVKCNIFFGIEMLTHLPLFAHPNPEKVVILKYSAIILALFAIIRFLSLVEEMVVF